jgi:hypothetical protein
MLSFSHCLLGSTLVWARPLDRVYHLKKACLTMRPLILILLGLLALSTQAQQVEQLQEDGSAAAYTDSESGKIITPTIEVKNGKRYYNWPMWNKFKNRKMQVHR